MKPLKKQSGAVLITSLVIVLILSVMIASSVQTTMLQQKMSANLRDRELAFQSSETAIKSGENFILTQNRKSLAGVFDGTNGLYTYNKILDTDDSTIDDLTTEASWGTIDTKGSHALHQVKETAKYIVEELPEIASKGGSLTLPKAITGNYYRITSKAKGGTDDSLVILQSIYKKP